MFQTSEGVQPRASSCWEQVDGLDEHLYLGVSPVVSAVSWANGAAAVTGTLSLLQLLSLLFLQLSIQILHLTHRHCTRVWDTEGREASFSSSSWAFNSFTWHRHCTHVWDTEGREASFSSSSWAFNSFTWHTDIALTYGTLKDGKHPSLPPAEHSIPSPDTKTLHSRMGHWRTGSILVADNMAVDSQITPPAHEYRSVHCLLMSSRPLYVEAIYQDSYVPVWGNHVIMTMKRFILVV